MNTDEQKQNELEYVPEFVTTAEVARVCGKHVRTIQVRIERLDFLPDAVLHCGRHKPIWLFLRSRLEKLKVIMAWKTEQMAEAMAIRAEMKKEAILNALQRGASGVLTDCHNLAVPMPEDAGASSVDGYEK